MTSLLLESVVILLLFVANGVFAMTELAVISARRARLKQLAEAGDRRARVALDLAEAPNRFLPTVQVGITLIGLLAGAFGGATVARQIALALAAFAPLAPYAEAAGVGVVVVALTYFSLVIGELVPKRLALANPEGIARRMARPMDWLSHLARPAVKLLGASTDLALKLLGVKLKPAPTVSDDEVKLLLREGMEAGVFHAAEPQMVASVLAFDQRPVQDIMTPREKIIFLNRTDPHEAVWHKIVVSGHSNFPVYDGARDRVVGVVSVKAIYANLAAQVGVRLADLMTRPLTVPATQTVMNLLDRFKQTGQHIALVVGENGAVVGLVTLVDVLEAIVGEIPSLEDRLRPEARRRPDGSLLVDGRFLLAKLEPLLGGVPLPAGAQTEHATVAEFVAGQLGRAAKEGDTFDWQGFRFEVIDMDLQRIDKVLICPVELAWPRRAP